jgi:hypothetical protein
MRKHLRRALLAATAALTLCIGTSTARADEWNHKTILTLDEAMQVPGATLQPGTYILKLADENGSRSLVNIIRASDNTLITTAKTVRMVRNSDDHGLALEVAMPAGKAPVPMLKGWMYPGFGGGHEFMYSKAQARQIANAETVEIPVAPRG